MDSSLVSLLAPAFEQRLPLLDEAHLSACRLFNGYLEGEPSLVADLYADSLVLFNHAKPPEEAGPLIEEAAEFYLRQLPWLQAVLVKSRFSRSVEGRRGSLMHGDKTAIRIREESTWYALDLRLNQDAGFYLDTRGLRAWIKTHLGGKSVLNAFAYTGSLGVAALAGGARAVVHLDSNPAFMEIAKQSYVLNGYPIREGDFLARDFFSAVAGFKKDGTLFDCVLLDPPFFSVSARGSVDMLRQHTRLINKVRPLIADGGWLVVVDNALFLGGADYLRSLEELCRDGYLSMGEIIPVPQDCIGYPDTLRRSLPSDPAPFNHATKIVILGVKRKAAAKQ